MNNSNADARTYAKKVEGDIQEFLSTEKIKRWVKDDSYEIKVYTKDEQLIN
ncbi:DUF4030 domain-containing protein [Bacillus cytotoxicus]|uniref:DUF4030 domain-containing protein n=1 Tax=Bacillus cytotoxicus TaxID=580165 RepID=A0ACC6AAY6_9BACI|nr:DUF4030 domain-containing protein [Bacillus cytotoxicus]